MKCFTPHCRDRKAKGKNYCHKCRKRRWRARNPMRSAFAQLRDHARERGIPFTITFEQFNRFAERTQYVKRTGLFKMSLTVDRKDNLRGYEPGNIKALSRSANAIKRAKQDEVRMRCGMSWAR